MPFALYQRHIPSTVHGRTAIAVAIPARDEADTIEACLKALDVSAGRAMAGRVRVLVLVLVNNSVDRTAELARSMTAAHLAIDVVEVCFPPSLAHAGTARRRAMDLCAARLPADGVLMTTDADSRVQIDWIAANLAELAKGADAVAGSIAFEEGDGAVLPVVRQQEWRLAALHARLHALLDPRPHERWPTHIWAWGASLAVSVRAYAAVGGLPQIPLAEDRALVALLDRKGFLVRHSLAPVVFTSARRSGRAPGGFADLLNDYIDDPLTLCDAVLEPTANLVRRLRWRARLRRRHGENEPLLCQRGEKCLRARAPDVKGSFGDEWDDIEGTSGRLSRERLRPADLCRETRRAERVIRLVAGKAGRADSLRFDPDGPLASPASPARSMP